MNKFFSFIIRQSVAIVLIVVFVLAFGVFSTMNMAINLLPDINVPMVCVQIIYPGANAQSVEEDVTAKVEEGLSSLSGVTAVDSYSYDNLSAVVLSFDYGTDTTEKKNDISSRLSSVDLPDGVTTDVYDIDLNAEALAVLSVTATDLESSYEAAKTLSARISAIDGVESVEIKGGADKVWKIRPYGGLELIAPLLVQAFSYGALDIPLGNLKENGSEVQIRNNTDVTSEADLRNTPVSLPSSMVTLLSAVKRIAKYYENSTAEELETLRADLDGGVLNVLRELDEMTADDLDDLAELKTYMNIADTYTAQNLTDFKTSRYYSEIYNRVDGKTDDELKDIADEINSSVTFLPIEITADLLAVVRDGKIDKLIAFRTELEKSDGYLEAQENNEYYNLTNDDYALLAEMLDLDASEEDIDFVKKTSATGLSAIADKKREEGDDYRPTDAECALLFTATELSSEHPVIMSPTFISFVRADSYDSNMQKLIDTRRGLDEEISAEEYYALYQSLELDGIIEINLSEKLIDFILETDLTDLTSTSDGEVLVVHVGDIATLALESEYGSYVYFGSGGEAKIIEGTTIEVYKSNGANSSSVVEAVKRVYAAYSSESAAIALGVKITLLDDQSQFISDSISNVLVSMVIGGVLAILVIFVFLKKVKTSLIIAVTMPLSVLAAMICLFLMGVTLNMVSLGGLAVGIGMLVDNSIVVIESISKHRDMDKTAFRAAVDGTTEVGGALFGSTLTTVCVFIPIIFSGGLTGEIFTDLSFAVIFSLSLSLIIAVTVIPALYAMFANGKRMLKGGSLSPELSGENRETTEPTPIPEAEATPETMQTAAAPETPDSGESKKTFRERLKTLKEPRLMTAITNFYAKILPRVLNRKIVPILSAVIIFGASIGMLFLTGTEFLPSIDKGQIEVNMTYGSTANLEEIQRDVSAFASRIEENVDDIEYVSVRVGKNGLLALTDTGIVTVQLTTNRGTDAVVDRIRKLNETDSGKHPDRSVTVRQIDGVVASLMSGADDLSVTVLGDDGDVLKAIASDVSAKLLENGFTDVKNSSTDKSVQYDIRFDRFAMAQKGLDYQTTVLTLRIGIASYTACTATIDGEDCTVSVSFENGAVDTVEDLQNFIIGYEYVDGSTSAVKLSDVAAITRTEVEACIRRSEGKQMVSISATLPGVDTGTAGKRMQSIAAAVLEGNPDYSGYEFQQSGISSYLNDAFAGLAVALVVSFFLLFAVMAVQFGSAIKSLIVMSGIPFSFTGGFLALVITGTSLNVVSFIGLIMLMGVIVNNAIVMLEKIKQLHDDGMPHYEAVQEACKVRLRPIFMTTLTTILALIPLAIGVGQGSELMQPLGIVVIGGLLIGTLVTLVLVPAVYSAVYRLSAKFPDGKKR